MDDPNADGSGGPDDGGPDAPEYGIAVVGCGNVSELHLSTYADAGFDVRILCDVDRSRAVARRDEFYPGADVCEDHRDVLDRSDVDVVDVTVPPDPRPPVVADCLREGRHVLSQKPFVTDLDTGERLVELADASGVRLAVNQNVRWAPHAQILRRWTGAGDLGTVHGVYVDRLWDYNRIAGDGIPHRLLFHYAIHWFDLARCLVDGEATRVYTANATTPGQAPSQPLVSQTVVDFADAQAALTFDGDTRHGAVERTTVTGSAGVAESTGAGLDDQTVTLRTDDGTRERDPDGVWNPTAFARSMRALLRAVGADTEPPHSGRDNLDTMELVFAAVASARSETPVVPGEVRRLPEPGS